MRTPRRLVGILAASALSWGGLALVTAPVAQADTGNRAPHDPATYYAGTEGLTGNALALALHDIIDGHTSVSYAVVYNAMEVLDEDPNDSTKLIDFYSGDSLNKADRVSTCPSCPSTVAWNREHTWPQSAGDFGTSAGAGTDLFHMRPSKVSSNSSRSNKDYDNGGSASVPGCASCKSTTTSFEPRSTIKGDAARGVLYMAIRYELNEGNAQGDLEIDECGAPPQAQACSDSDALLGKLSTLVAWSLADPPDNGERTRNDLIDGTYQGNRNPFIDHPEWVCSIWGSQVPAALCATNNTAPTTSPMTKSIAEDSGPTTVALTADDVDGDTLTWSIAGTPAHGSASITGGSTLNYTPAANYHGQDVVGVTVSDGKGGTAATTVTLTITPVNDAPVATPRNTSTPQGVAKVITLAGTDVENDSLSYAIATGPSHGSVDLVGDQATYTPAGGYSGQDSFTFTVSDGTLTSAPATVSINVTTVNHAPTATPQSVSTPEDTATVVTLAGADQDGDTLTYALGTQPTHGSLSLVGNQATYTPAADYDGPDSFTFTVNDGALTSAPATVSITVEPANDAPAATAQSVSTAEDTPTVITLAGSDVDGDELTFALADQPTHGTVSLSGDEVTYTPAADYAGDDSFTFTVDDGTATSAPATVSIDVTPVNDEPTATAQSVSTAEDTPTVITLTGADVDIDDELTFALVDQPSHGSVSLSGDEATYTPAANYHGPDSFTFTVGDGVLTSAAATVSIDVTPVDDTPTVFLATPAATRGKPVTTTVVVSGPSGSPTPSGQVLVQNGSATLGVVTLGVGGTATLTWTPTRAGIASLVATYAGGEGYDPASSAVTPVAVAKSASLLKLAGKFKKGKAGKVKIAIASVGGQAATGKVTIKVAGKKYTATLKNGVAKFKVRATTKAKVKVKVTYAGDSQYGAAKGKKVYVTS